MRYFWLIFVYVAVLVGCTCGHPQPTRSSPDLSAWPPQPRPPVRGVDPSCRHWVSIRLPTGLHVTRDEWFHYVFTGFERCRLTVGHKMITGIKEEIDFRRDGTNAFTYVTG